MRKRIAIVIDSLAGGGAEIVALRLAIQFRKMGHVPHLLLLQDNCLLDVPEQIQVDACYSASEKRPGALIGVSKAAKRLKSFIEDIERKQGKFDLFLSNLDRTNLLMAKINVSPLHFIIHSSVERELARQKNYGPLKYLAMLRAKQALSGQHLVTVSEGIANEIKTRHRISPASCITIYNPFDSAEITDKASQAQPMPDGDYIIHVGRLSKGKRHDILLRAFAQMDQKIPLVLLCNNPQKARKLAQQYGVAERVIVPGFQQNPYPWIKNARLLVLSSEYEGLSNTLIEALILGTAVVSTDCDFGPREILTGPLATFLSPVNQATPLAANMDKALRSYPDINSVDFLNKIEAVSVAKQYLNLLQP